MSDNKAPEGLDLAAMMCSRVCHDVIGPVGAINNGLEVLEDEKSEDMRAFALDLIKKSAAQASAKLQFARLAFGAGSTTGSTMSLGDVEDVARGFIESDKLSLAWNAAPAMLDKNQVKLLANLLMIAANTIPRGGTVTVDADAEPARFTVTCSGINARVPAGVADIVGGALPEDGIDAHWIQPFHTFLLAQASNMTIRLDQDGDTVVIAAL
ncbi:MAG: histidine phosphotransferase family protein [Pseudomonadota bacterium]